jgi:hypothetical protein
MTSAGRMTAVILTVATFAGPVLAGDINLAWDPTPGASGYKVYYGTAPGSYTSPGSPAIVYGTQATISGLQDCRSYFVAVKAFNAAGESTDFSNELSGWSRPSVAGASPSSAMQGDQLVMDIQGTNFQSGASVDLGNPQIMLTSVAVLSCSHIQLLATIDPTAAGIRPAQIGSLDVTVENPDSVFGKKSQAFVVLINPARFDVNKSDALTTNRIDGKDMVYISRQFGLTESDPNYDGDDDFDGDGRVDGEDLAYIASNFGLCWAQATKTWTLAACPNNLN